MKKLLILTISAMFLLPTFTRAQACMEPASDEGITIIGFIQPQFEYLFAGQNAQGKRIDESSFYFNRARLGVTGNIPYDFSYYLITEISPTLNGANNIQPPLLLDAFISYNRFAPYMKVSAGQFKVPFGIELPQACHKLYTINRSIVVSNLVDPWRDLGVMVTGSTGDKPILGIKTKNFLSYSLGVFNGGGLNKKDINLNKSVVGRLAVRPIDLVTVGASYRFTKLPPQADGVTEDDTRKRLGMDVELNYKNFIVQGEYVYGADNGSYTTGGGCGGEVTVHQGSKKRDGFFVQALYMTPWRLQPVVRYEKFDPDLDMAPDQVLLLENGVQNVITYGINYFFNDKVRLQINYLYRAEETAKLEYKNDMILTQFQIVF